MLVEAVKVVLTNSLTVLVEDMIVTDKSKNLRRKAMRVLTEVVRVLVQAVKVLEVVRVLTEVVSVSASAGRESVRSRESACASSDIRKAVRVSLEIVLLLLNFLYSVGMY
jgi:hypothetical protein